MNRTGQLGGACLLPRPSPYLLPDLPALPFAQPLHTSPQRQRELSLVCSSSPRQTRKALCQHELNQKPYSSKFSPESFGKRSYYQFSAE